MNNPLIKQPVSVPFPPMPGATQAQPEATPQTQGPAPAKISWTAKKNAAIEHAQTLAGTNQMFAIAMSNPAAAFERLAKMGFTLSIGAQARKTTALKWKQSCCQIIWDADANGGAGALAWASTTWDTAVTVFEPEHGAKVSYKAGDTRPQSVGPVTFQPFDVPMIVMTGDLFAIDLDWPGQFGVNVPADYNDYPALLAMLRAHASFNALWEQMLATIGEAGAMTWLASQLIQRTRSGGFQLIGRKAHGTNDLLQVTGALALPYTGKLPDGYDATAQGVPLCSMDTRGVKADGTTAGMVYGPGTVVAVDDKLTDKTGAIVRVEQWYQLIAGGGLTMDTLSYLPDAAADFIAANVPAGQERESSGDFKARTEPSELIGGQSVPAHAIAAAGSPSLADGMDTPTMRDPQRVKDQMVHSITRFTAEYAATKAAAAGGTAPITRTAPAYEDYQTCMKLITWPLTGSAAFGEFGADLAKGEEIAKSIYDTATQMFAAAGVDTSKNEELWQSEMISAHAKVAAKDPSFARAGRLEDVAKSCGWVSPAIAPAAMIQQPPAQATGQQPTQSGTQTAQAAPVAAPAGQIGTLSAVSASGRKRRILSSAVPKFAPATGTPVWAVFNTRKDPVTKQLVRAPVPCEATAAQAASHMGLGGQYNELNDICEVLVPAGTDLAGMQVGEVDLSPALARSVAMGASIAHSTRFGTKIMDEALRMICEERPYNPVADYLMSCQMVQGVTCDQLFRKYTNVLIGGDEGVEAVCPKYGTTESQLADIQSELTMVAAVGRALDAGGEFQMVPVIVSHGQGVGKSDMWKALVPDKDWHGDVPLFGLGPKEIAEKTAGKWIQENAEMQGFSRTAAEEMKGLISRTGDQARKAYGHDARKNLRRWLLVCTSNIMYFLNDPSGGRRYWPWLTEKVDVAGIARDRDALWAHAVHLFFTKYQGDADLVRLEEKYWNLSDMVREKFIVSDPKEDKLQMGTMLGANGAAPTEAKVTPGTNGDYLWFPSVELYRIVNGQYGKLTHGGSGEIASMLRRLGWTAHKADNIRGWRRVLLPDEQAAYDAMCAKADAARAMAGGGNVVPMIAPQGAQAAPVSTAQPTGQPVHQPIVQPVQQIAPVSATPPTGTPDGSAA